MSTPTDRVGYSSRCKFLILAAALFLLIYWQLSSNQNKPARLDIRYVQENLESLDQTDPQLIEYVRARHLSPPSRLPYTLPKGEGYHKDATIDWVRNFFRGKRNGIFIEVGAHDGLRETHTLYLERELGWSGLLIECHPSLFTSLRSLHRNAWMANACLSLTTHAGILNFTLPINTGYDHIATIGTLKRRHEVEKRMGWMSYKWISFDVETIPLYTLLAAWGRKEIDYFSFDIEGGELAVLKTFLFSEFIFKVLIIETLYYHDDERKELDALVQSKGYHFVKMEPRLKTERLYLYA